MPGLDQEEEEEAPPPVLMVASTGPSAWKYSELMGEYRLTEQRSAGRAVYKHCTEELYIYSSPSNGNWLVGPTVGGGAAGLLNYNSSSDCLPQTGWLYYDGSVWPADPDLSVMPAPASQPQCEQCASLTERCEKLEAELLAARSEINQLQLERNSQAGLRNDLLANL